MVGDDAVLTAGPEVVSEREQLIGGQCRLHQDDRGSRPRVEDFQLDRTDIDKPHPLRLQVHDLEAELSPAAVMMER